MKKYFQAPDYIALHRSRAKRKHERALAHKDWKKGINTHKFGTPRDQRRPAINKSDKREHILKGYRAIKAPTNFSFISNSEEVVSFISDLKIAFDKRHKVYVVLDEILNIDYGAIVVLLSIMVRFKSAGIGFNGNFPKSRAARSLLIQSGFFNNLFKEFSLEDSYQIKEGSNHEGICTHAQKKVDAVLSDKIITEASKTVWGEVRRCPGIQRTLIELMQNTNNHATIGKTGEKHWWLSVHHDKTTKTVAFSFVDFGVGIFENLSNKPERSKFYNWKEKIKDKLFYGNNAELLRLILDGTLHRTVTENDFRGKGLPGIAGALNRNQLSTFHIITNDAYADVSNGIYTKLDKSFSGTFVYWELNENNDSKK